MSVIEGKNPTSLRMKFDLGKDELTNKTKVKSKTYSNIKPEATSQAIYDVATALEGLQEFPVLEVVKLIIQHWPKFYFVYKLNNHNLI